MKTVNVKIIQRVTEEWSGTISIPDDIKEDDIQNYIDMYVHGSDATLGDIVESYNMEIKEVVYK